MFMIGLVYAFRAEIHVAGGDLRVGSLLGAPPRWIATPHILVSMFSGFIGLVLAGGAIYALIATSIDKAPWLKAVKYEEFAMMAIGITSIGLVLSIWQSMREARRAVRTMDT